MTTNQRSGRTALSGEVIATFFGLGAGAAGVGTASTSVLRWLTAGTAVVSPYLVITDSAAEGTLIQVMTPGSYRAELGLAQIASSDLIAGISIGFAAVTPLAVAPLMGVNGVIATLPVSTLAASTTMGHVIGVNFTVPDEEVGTVLAPGSRALLRFRAAVAAGTTPIPALTPATCWARVIRIADQAA
jgi:hypothetical protein